MYKNKKRLIPLMLIVVLLLSCIPNVAFAAESDESDQLIYHFAYITGYNDGTVRPKEDITRAEAATLIFRLLANDVRSVFWSATNGFSDVSSNNWYNNAVSTTSNGGFIKGYGDGTFRGGNSIKRGEFVTLVARLVDISYTGKNKFPDISNHWAAEYINAVADHGWITGYKDGTFRPDQYITRAEAITILNRLQGRDKISADDMLDDMVAWSDNKPGTWYYEAVQEATNSHTHLFREDGTEYWIEIKAAPDWVELER